MQFDVYAVADALELQLTKKAGDELIFICPFCSVQKQYPKLYVNHNKGTFICHHCHLQGSITDLWAIRCGISTKEAYKQMLNLAPGDFKTENITADRYIPAHPDKLNKVYSEFLRMLHIEEKHRENLLNRGLPEFYLKHFKSLPEDPRHRWGICRVLNKKYNLSDVPGFSLQTSKKGKQYWDCYRSGLLIPVKDVYGRITSFQIRTENQERKYIWFAYSGQLKSSAHIIPGKGIPWIIEGVLKSYVTHYFLNIPCIGIPGTNTWKTIPLEIIRGGKAVVCYDNENNSYSAEAKDKLVQYLQDNGFEVIVAGWNKNLGKGIDDACLSLYKQGITPKPEMFLPGIAA